MKNCTLFKILDIEQNLTRIHLAKSTIQKLYIDTLAFEGLVPPLLIRLHLLYRNCFERACATIIIKPYMNIHLDIFKPCCNFFNSFKYAIKPPIIICLPKFTSTSENGNWTNSLSFFLFLRVFHFLLLLLPFTMMITLIFVSNTCIYW